MVQPLETFDLSISTAMGIAAWLITNLIVLLQFRAGEDPKPAIEEAIRRSLLFNDTIIVA